MELTGKQFERTAPLLPRQRGNVKTENRRLLNALIYRCENGCKWRALPGHLGDWHGIYTQLDRWARNGALERVCAALTEEGFPSITVRALNSTATKAHPDARGAKKNGTQAARKSRGGWNTKIHAVTMSGRQIMGFSLSEGNAADAPIAAYEAAFSQSESTPAFRRGNDYPRKNKEGR